MPFESLLFYVFGSYLFFGSFRCQQKVITTLEYIHKKQAQNLRARKWDEIIRIAANRRVSHVLS